MTGDLPAQIGRFRVLKELGKGSQGVVYLALDPQLERQVAIKTIHSHVTMSEENYKRLMEEARTVSKLQHPNIIPLYEAGQHQEKPYLVFEFVDGLPLREILKREGTFIIHRAIKLLIQVLDGIAYAHKQGVIHRDMSPNNIMVEKNDMPRIMDFGISLMAGNKKNGEGEFAGTLCYMSPEHFSQKNLGPQADIFSLGLIFYEMLVGHPVIKAENQFTAMFKIAHEPIPPPSLENQSIDKKLDAIILKALEKDTEKRYKDGFEMKRELNQYLSEKDVPEVPAERSQGKTTHVTLDFLLQRMRHKTDFPAFSHHISEINQKVSSREDVHSSASQISNVIVKDIALTNKLLKLVNSAFYGQCSGGVTTISRAVFVMGVEQVKEAASSLLLFEHLQNKSQSGELKDSAISSFMSALIAKDLANKAGLKNTEEAFICAMLHNLGKHLVIFYLAEEYEQIKNLMVQKGIDEAAAVRTILGISYGELGTGVAKSWGFPESIVNSMKDLSRKERENLKSQEDLLCGLATFSNELCSLMTVKDPDEREETLTTLLKHFEKALPVSKKEVSGLIDVARKKVERYSSTLNINIKESSFLKQLGSCSSIGEEGSVTGAAKEGESGKIEERLDERSLQLPEEPDEPGDQRSILISGIQEITSTLLDPYEINAVLTMILETMYRGFAFHRVLLCLIAMDRTKVNARFGFGSDIQKVIETFNFKMQNIPDVFNIALTEGKEFLVNDTEDPGMKRAVPEWYRKTIGAPAFALYPILISKIPVGLFYVDRETSGNIIPGNQLNYMKTLCKQAVLAIMMSRKGR